MKKQWNEWLWEAWCIASGVGIWPRYIEPRLLSTTHLSPSISTQIEGLKILHFTDLHWNRQFPKKLIVKIKNKIDAFKPDLILFTGDFLCRSRLENANELKLFLRSLNAPLGCFAVLGNHDYARFVTVNSKGDYDVEQKESGSIIGKGFKRLFSSTTLTGASTPEVGKIGYHEELIDLLNDTPFLLLNNQTIQVLYKGLPINICGLEDYFLGRFNPEIAFKKYLKEYPGIVLSHNPDTFRILKGYPGDLILSGHTHGGQINLPFLWKRLTRMENPQYKRGLFVLDSKWGYVNRGISSVMKFRWFAMPELTCITMR